MRGIERFLGFGGRGGRGLIIYGGEVMTFFNVNLVLLFVFSLDVSFEAVCFDLCLHESHW